MLKAKCKNCHTHEAIKCPVCESTDLSIEVLETSEIKRLKRETDLQFKRAEAWKTLAVMFMIIGLFVMTMVFIQYGVLK